MGFAKIDGDDESWVMLANSDTKIGLFHGMFDTNIVTFNPPDARLIEQAVTAAGYDLLVATEGETGAAHFLVADPDGNTVMFDQHAQ